MNFANPLALLNLLNLLIIPLGYLVHRLGTQIDGLQARLIMLERDALTRREVDFWRPPPSGATRTVNVPARRRDK